MYILVITNTSKNFFRKGFAFPGNAGILEISHIGKHNYQLIENK